MAKCLCCYKQIEFCPTTQHIKVTFGFLLLSDRKGKLICVASRDPWQIWLRSGVVRNFGINCHCWFFLANTYKPYVMVSHQATFTEYYNLHEVYVKLKHILNSSTRFEILTKLNTVRWFYRVNDLKITTCGL